MSDETFFPLAINVITKTMNAALKAEMISVRDQIEKSDWLPGEYRVITLDRSRAGGQGYKALAMREYICSELKLSGFEATIVESFLNRNEYSISIKVPHMIRLAFERDQIEQRNTTTKELDVDE